MRRDEVRQAEEKLQQKAANGCARDLAARYQGTNCMGTSIHGHMAEPSDTYGHFFYDDQDMLMWHHASSHRKLSAATSNHYSFLEETNEKNYIRYDNGVEGIRVDRKFRYPASVQKVPAPLPDLTTSKEGASWHSHSPETLPAQYCHVHGVK